MGCDIHLYFEKKNQKDDWEQIEIPECLLPDQRHYLLFAFLADVKNYFEFDVVALFPSRGIPKDTSLPEESDDFCMGDHSFTYCYLDEILAADWEKYELHDCYFYIFCRHVLDKIIGYISDEKSRDIRVIMGFDN